ncbi:hypothetical protein [Comamonas sp. B21-038]|uniref:hypothetical protein n=1 Tax=Comamonas sp. B21-038 TaxID=2918299 RepID=UPI001EFACC8D|nr:hypothetical protein [Comamonas sp. B21-038]ULR87411.1 hypothetical protein MJ205_13145 [Comamonas sp. B21-038]
MTDGIATVAAAALAGLISLLVVVITKEQKVSEFRQQWIDALRADVSALLAAYSVAHQMVIAWKKDNRSESELWEKHKDLVTQADTLMSQIKLRLNPNEHLHQTLEKHLDQLDEQFASDKPCEEVNTETLDKRILETTRKILKEEWNRVRRGEATHRWALRIATAIFAICAAILAFLVYESIADNFEQDATAQPQTSQITLEPTATKSKKAGATN